jgi:hypothetical protein
LLRETVSLGIQEMILALQLKCSDFQMVTRSICVAAIIQDAQAMLPSLQMVLSQLDLTTNPPACPE